MKSLLVSLIPTVLIVVAFGCMMAFLKLYELSRKGRRSPLTSQLMRSPGASLREQIDDLSNDILSYIVVIPIIPLSVYSVWLSQVYFGAAKASSFLLLVCLVTAVALTFYCFFKLWRLLKKRNALRLGLDCELAVGQELNNLMLDGYRVYHDFPAEKFNIDHVVVGPKGVFAVETKGRAKRNKKGGAAEATVVYDGNGLQFPGWLEKEPIDQAKRQASWLEKWLSSAVGEPVSVKPVLVLPGWFIELRKPANVFIFNGKNPQSLLKGQSENILAETMIKRIAHQLEQRCRDVEPVGYRKK
jgi:hypothetical protein